jgi:hypothetical protein
MAQRPDPSATIQQLTVEVANAYKIASDRAEFQIQTLNQERQALVRQLETERNNNKKQVEQLQAQLGALQLQLDSRSGDPSDNVLSSS